MIFIHLFSFFLNLKEGRLEQIRSKLGYDILEGSVEMVGVGTRLRNDMHYLVSVSKDTIEVSVHDDGEHALRDRQASSNVMP